MDDQQAREAAAKAVGPLDREEVSDEQIANAAIDAYLAVSGEAHRKILVHGEIEVCSTCVNSHSEYVAWDQAHPGGAHAVAPEQPTQATEGWAYGLLNDFSDAIEENMQAVGNPHDDTATPVGESEAAQAIVDLILASPPPAALVSSPSVETVTPSDDELRQIARQATGTGYYSGGVKALRAVWAAARGHFGVSS